MFVMSAPLRRGSVAGQANVAVLKLIEGGECLPGTAAAQPTLDGGLERQYGVHDQAEDVILSQEAGVRLGGVLGGGRQIPILA